LIADISGSPISIATLYRGGRFNPGYAGMVGSRLRIGGIPARTLENNHRQWGNAPHHTIDAFWTLLQRFLKKRFVFIKLIVATLTLVGVNGHLKTSTQYI
jgi:hypothetical protein